MIRFIDVYKEYDNGTKALKGIDLRIDDGEFVFLEIGRASCRERV